MVTDHLTREASRAMYAPGTEFHIARVDLVGNTGTYLDTPAHRYEDGWDTAQLPLDRVALVPLVVIEGNAAIGADLVRRVDVRGKAVLFRTGWDRRWGTTGYHSDRHPHLTAAAAEALVASGAVVVGIDSVNIDDTSGGERPAHTRLLGAGVPIVEHLCNLAAIPQTRDATFTAVPVKVAGVGTFPVRAFVAVASRGQRRRRRSRRTWSGLGSIDPSGPDRRRSEATSHTTP